MLLQLRTDHLFKFERYSVGVVTAQTWDISKTTQSGKSEYYVAGPTIVPPQFELLPGELGSAVRCFVSELESVELQSVVTLNPGQHKDDKSSNNLLFF